MNELTTYAFWKKIGEIQNLQGTPKFGGLTKLVNACLSISHGNAEPERGFSANKKTLQDRESLEPETIVALRGVKNFIDLCGKPVTITRRLLDLCYNARQKYFAHLEVKKAEEKSRLTRERQEQENLKKQVIRKTSSEKISEVETSIRLEGDKLASAEVLIADSNKTLQNLINSNGKINKEQLIKAQMLLKVGIDKSSECKAKLSDLQKLKYDLLSKKNSKSK